MNSPQRIKLIPITTENERECIQLSPSADQMNLVASNADSLIHATKEATSKAYGIYTDHTMVGFVLFDQEVYPDGYYWILRFMIDVRYQGNGYGTAAIREVIDHLQLRRDCTQIRVSHVPHNTSANQLYKKCGFIETGEFEDNGDIILAYYMRERALTH